MSSTGINKELYCDYAIFYNNITCLSDINVSGLSVFNNLNVGGSTTFNTPLGWIAFHSRMCHTFCEAPMKQTEACPWGCQIFVAQRRRRRQGGRPSLPPNSTRVATRGVPTKETTHASCCLRRPVDRPTTRLPATCRRPRAQPGPVCGASYMRFPHQSSFRSPFEFSAA